MGEATVALTLPQMIDCAVSYPECGSVNFSILHSVLQILVQQMELVSCKVEFKGKEGELIHNFLELGKNAPKTSLTEYIVTPAKDAGKHLIRGKKEKEKEENAVYVEDIASPGDLQTIVVVETEAGKTSSSEPTIISKAKIEEILNDIFELKKSVKELSEMPANQTLISAIRQVETGKGTPILEIFQSVSLTKRLDATEAQVQKLAVMLEDLIKSNPNLGCPPGMDGSDNLCDRLKAIDEKISSLERAIGYMQGGGSTARSMLSVPLEPGEEQGSKGPEGPKRVPGKPPLPPMKEPTTSVADFSNMDLNEFKTSVHDALKSIREDIRKLYERVMNCEEQAKTGGKHKIKGEGEEVPEGAEDRITELEIVFQEIGQQINSLDATFNNEFQNLQAQFTDMEKEFGNLMEKIHVGIPGGEGQVSGETVGELYEKILGIQTDMESLAETASKLMEDKDQKEKLFDLLTEQIDMLKTIKADKEDLEDALADKADACAINRKVSHDQFDTACDELSKGIEEALTKLTQQEQLWQAALDEIQREIGNKLDRMELAPLRDFINQKLKILQQKLKSLLALKQETEAAGTKRFLKNVQCISCDKDVVMRKEMDPSLLPKPYALPPTRSMGPYLAYELDALRKQQKSLPTSRNLNHFESALQSKSPRPGEDHICNRYCGGSHTTTTPQQRVTRLGHFLNQWGPEAQPVCDSSKEDESPLIVSGRGTDRKASALPDVASAIHKDVGAGDMVPAVPEKRDSKESQRKGSASELKDKKDPPSRRTSRTSSVSKVSGTKVSVRISATSGKSPSKKQPSQTSGASSAMEKRGSKTSAPRIPEETPEEAAAEAGEHGEGPPPPSEAGGEAETVEEATTDTGAEETASAVAEAPVEAVGGEPAQ